MEMVLTYTRRVRAIRNHITGHLNLQQWHIAADGSIGWHGIAWPD